MRVILIISVLFLTACERDVCIECTKVTSGTGTRRITEEFIICGKYTNGEAQKIRETVIVIDHGGTKTKITCTE